MQQKEIMAKQCCRCLCSSWRQEYKYNRRRANGASLLKPDPETLLQEKTRHENKNFLFHNT